MGKRTFQTLAAAVAVLCCVTAADAAIHNATFVGYNAIFGAGNSNTQWSIEKIGNLDLALRAHVRYPDPDDDPTGPGDTVNGSVNDGNGLYGPFDAIGYFPGSPGTPGGPRGSWNFDFSINTNVSGTGSDLVSAYTYLLEVDNDPSLSTNFAASFDPVFSGYPPDNSYGNNGTPNDGSAVEGAAGVSPTGLAYNNSLVQNSQNLAFLNFIPGFNFNPTTSGRYDIRLTAFQGGDRIGSVGIQVDVGDGAGTVPEPASFMVWGFLASVFGGAISCRTRKA